jgi:hypothetical protein
VTFNPDDWEWENLNGNWNSLATLSPHYKATELKIRRKLELKDGYYVITDLMCAYYRSVAYAGATPVWTVRGSDGTWTHSDIMFDGMALSNGFTYLGNGDPDD